MYDSSQPTKEASVLVVDPQHLLRNALCAEVRIDCSITAYEARTSGEAIALTQEVQPDVVLLDLGVQDASSAELLQQFLEGNTRLGLLVYSDTLAGRLKESTVSYMMQSPSVKHFSLALRCMCSEMLLSEPDMAHRFFRTWHQHALEAWAPGTSERRQLKVLVLALRDLSSQGSSTWQFITSRWKRPHLENWIFARHSLTTDFRQLIRYAGDWMSRNWRVVRQFGYSFISSLWASESSLAPTKTNSHTRPFHRLSI